MATKIASLAVEIGVDSSKLEAGLKATRTQLSGIGKEAETAGSKIGAFAGGFAKFAAVGGITALGAAFVSTVKSAAELETTFGKIAALTDTPKSAIAGLRDEVLKLATDIPVSATEMSKALYFISSSGIKGADAMKVLEVSSKAAAAGLGDTQVIADAVTSALNAYGLGADKATKITDILVATVREGKGEPAELAGSLGKILPIAAAAGVSMEQVAAAMATMTRTGMNADEAATSLRGTIGALMAPGKQAADALASIGLTTEDVASKLKGPEGLVGVLQLLMERTGGNVETLDAIIPNIRALTGVLSTAGSQGAEYARILESMNNAAGTTDAAFASMSDTMEFKLKKAQNSLEALGTAITTALLPGLGQAADAVTLFVGGFDKLQGAVKGVEADVLKSSTSYTDYKNAVVGAAEQAGLLNRTQAEYIRTHDDLTGVEQRLIDLAGIQTKANYDLARSYEARMMAARIDMDQEKQLRANYVMPALQPTSTTKQGTYEPGAQPITQKVTTEFAAVNTGADLKADAKDIKAMGEYYGGLTEKAIAYTSAEKQMADLKEKLKKADAEILAAGTAQIGVVQNKKMSEDQYAAALAKSAKIQEDLTIGARKKNETDAEYTSRMADLQVTLNNVNASLGTHAGALGGATEAQLKNRDAIKEQIAALTEQDAKARAMEGINVLQQSLKDGRITLDQYNERVTQINQRTGLFTESALAASLAQTAWLQAIGSGVATQQQMDAALKSTTDQLGLYYAALNLLPREILISIRAELANPEIVGDILNMGNLGGMGASAPAAAATATAAPRPAARRGAQAASGADFIVPAGYPRDSFNLGVTSGEHVMVDPSGGSMNNTTNNVSINIAAISRDFTPQQAGDEIINRMRSRGLVA